jgi:hypothetical protein
MSRVEARVRARVFAVATDVVTLAIGVVAACLSHLPVENARAPRLRSTLGAGPTSALWWLLVLGPPVLMLVVGRNAPVDVVKGWLAAIAIATVFAYSVLLLIAA